MKTIVYALFAMFTSTAYASSADALLTQPTPAPAYEEFVRLSPERRDEVYRQLSADTRAAFLKKRFELWLAENRGQLSSRQVAAVEEAINLVTPEMFTRAPDARVRERQDAVSHQLRCSLGQELAYSFANGEAAPVRVERTWTQILHSWTEWVVDCVMK